MSDYGLSADETSRVADEAERLIAAHLDGSAPLCFADPIDFGEGDDGRRLFGRIVEMDDGRLIVIEVPPGRSV